MAYSSSVYSERHLGGILSTSPLKSPETYTEHTSHKYNPVPATEILGSNGNAYPDATGQRDYHKWSDWWLELSSWTAGVASFGGIVAILVHFNNRLIEEWHAPIQITSVVAFLAQLTQSALLLPTESSIGQLKWLWYRRRRKTAHLELFDGASRGPAGSILLLFNLGFIPHLVHFGALITIFMAVFSTFFQQAVQIRLQGRPLNGSSLAREPTVARLTNYVPFKGQSIYAANYIYTAFQGQVTDTYLTNTINAGLLAKSHNLSDVQSDCPSEKCTWKPYTTLAICHAVEEVTSQLVNVTDRQSDATKQVTLPGIMVHNDYGKYTLWLSTVFGNGNETRDPIGQNINRTKDGPFSLKNKDSNLDDLAHVYLVYQDPCLTDGKPVLDVSLAGKEAFRAFKSTFKLCLQTLSTTHNTSTETTVLKSHTNLQWLKHEVDGLNYFKVNWTTGDQTDTFSFPMQSAEIIGGQLATSLNFTASLRGGPGGGDNYIYGYGSGFASNFIADVLGNDPTICQKGDGFGSKGVQRRIETVATGLTNALRTSNSNIKEVGTSFQTVQFIHVEFWTLAPPGALLLAITIFFFVTMIRTTHMPVWKSSQLALLYALHEPERLGTKSEMEKEAEHTNLRYRVPGGWQLQFD